MTRGYMLLFSLGMLILGGHLLCAAQSRTSDQQLFQAVAKGDIGAVRIALANGADLESKDERGATPLMVAAGHFDIQMVKVLLDKGANVSARDNYEETALTETARSFNPELLRILLNGNPDLKEKNAALFEASEAGPVVLHMTEAPEPSGRNEHAPDPEEQPWVTNVRLLLDSGAELEARDQEGETPLIRAASFGQTDIFRLLLQRGANISVRDQRGMTPLIAAACACAVATMNSTYDIMKILIEKGANVNVRDHDGRTALMLAASSPDDPASLELLLSKGADPMAKDTQGDTALTFARKGYRPEKAVLLKKAMARAH